MSKVSDFVEVEGVISAVLPGGEFEVSLDIGKKIVTYLSGKMKQFQIRIGLGDRVKVEISKYSLDKGRITYRQPRQVNPNAK
jgi:translation initiation factor IF-1